MKSKNLLLLTLATAAFVSCEDLGTINLDTTLTKTLSIDVEDNEALGASGLKSSYENGYLFNETDIIELTDNEDLKSKLDDINEMDVYQVSCKLNGIPDGEVIQELTIFSTTAGLSITLNNLTENNSSIELEVSAEVLKSLGEQLLQYEQLEIGASGVSSYAPMTFTVELTFDTKVKTKII